MYRRALLATVLLNLTLSSVSAQAPAAGLRVLSSNGVRAVIEELRPALERAAGVPLTIEYSTATSLKSRIDGGEPFDVTILPPALVDDLIGQRRVSSPRFDLARAGVGVGAREGSAHGAVDTQDNFRRVLLAADSVAFTAQGQSRGLIETAFAKLGIAAEMGAKTHLLGPGEAPEAVAAGEAELVLTLTSEILPVPGLRLLGPLPNELQGYIAFAVGRGANAANATAAAAFVDYLARTDLTAALAKHGMELVPSAR
jgi:molybdate transport system substrate-binding protein